MKASRRLATAAVMACVLLCAACARTSASAVVAPSATTSPPPCPATGAVAPQSGGLPHVSLSCLGSGTKVDTQRLRGPAVVNLWASWCEPCQQEMPLLQQAAARQGTAVQIIGVNTNDSVPPALAFLRRTGATYPQLSDPTGKLAIALRSPGLPVTVAVDSAGHVVWRKVGLMVADDVAAAVRAATTGSAAGASTSASRG
jgi:thiol-disulfide isomerase/thioredoxin